MTAAAEYITGALITALIATAVLFVFRTCQAVRRHFRRVARKRAGARSAARSPQP